MEYATLGKTDIKVSRVCIGGMSFGKVFTDFHQWVIDLSPRSCGCRCSDRKPQYHLSPLSRYEKLCRYMSFSDVGMVLGLGCGNPNMTAASPFLQDAYELGRNLS